MWDLIVSVPDHCLFFYFTITCSCYPYLYFGSAITSKFYVAEWFRERDHCLSFYFFNTDYMFCLGLSNDLQASYDQFRHTPLHV